MKDENGHIDELDDLIRNDSEREVYTMQESDWDQLQMMMDGDERRKWILWFWRSGLELFLFGACFLFVAYTNYIDQHLNVNDALKMTKTETRDQSGVDGENATDQRSKENLSSDLIEYPRNEIENSINDAQSESDTEYQVAASSNYFKPKDAGQKVTGRPKHEIGNNKDADENLVSATRADLKQFNKTEGEEDRKVNSLSEDDTTLSSTLSVGDESSRQVEHETVNSDTVISLQKMPEIDLGLVPENSEDDLLATNSEDSLPAKSTDANRKMHVYLGVGTEWSAVRSNMPVGPTKLKVQLGGEYQILKKLSVLSGINYTVKDYQTNTDGYTVKPGFWTNGIKPNAILAKCNVLEVPLNLRYYFKAQNKRQSSFFVTAGASSLVMASERYDFMYDVEDPTLKPGWSGKWENVHYLSMLHFSAGYQKSLKKNCSLLFEPYVDVPLNGIGFGQVDLVSFGLSVQVKY